MAVQTAPGKKNFHADLRESNLQQEDVEDSLLAGTVQDSKKQLNSAE